MSMSFRERILAVYRGQTPDVVPFMLDLSHWFLHKNKIPWDLSKKTHTLQTSLIDYHKANDVGFYIPNNVSFYDVRHTEDVEVTAERSTDGNAITWRYKTPRGTICRTRVWEEDTYSWGIKEWGIKTEDDLKVLGYAEGSRIFAACWDRYQAWKEYVGDSGVIYVPSGYSGIYTFY